MKPIFKWILRWILRELYCAPCQLRERCTQAKNMGRTLTIYPQERYLYFPLSEG